MKKLFLVILISFFMVHESQAVNCKSVGLKTTECLLIGSGVVALNAAAVALVAFWPTLLLTIYCAHEDGGVQGDMPRTTPRVFKRVSMFTGALTSVSAINALLKFKNLRSTCEDKIGPTMLTLDLAALTYYWYWCSKNY